MKTSHCTPTVALGILTVLLVSAPGHSAAQDRFAAGPPPTPETAPVCSMTGTAMVLSGGGAWGLGHVGVLKALDEAGIRPAFIVGASMGAIIAAAYATGATGAEIEEMVLHSPLQKIFTGYRPELPEPLRDLPVALLFRQEPGEKPSLQLPMANQAVAERIIQNALSRGAGASAVRFQDLEIPLVVIATDVLTREMVPISSGDVTLSVLASSAIPMLLPPVEIDGRLLMDGSLTSNIPVQTARDLGARRVIISDVSDHLEKAGLDPHSLGDMAAVVLHFLFNQEDYVPGPEDLLIRPDLKEEPKLEFSGEQKRKLIQRGYETGKAALRRVGCPSRNAGSLGGSAGRSPGLSASLSPRPPSAEMAITPNDFPVVSRSMGISGGYDHELGASGWIGLVDSGLFGGRATATGVAVLGSQEQRLELSLGGRPSRPLSVRPLISGTVARERIRRFDSFGRELPSLNVPSMHLFAGPEARFGRDWTVAAGLRLDRWHDPSTGPDGASVGAQVIVTKSRRGTTRLHLEAMTSTAYSRIAAEAEWPIRVGQGTLTPSVRWGVGTDLPTQMAFALGGRRGFPGLHLGEGLGSREALVRLGADYPLMGPLSIRGDLAYGVTDGGPWARPADRPLLGFRAGIGIDTVLGPVDLAYGWTETGRRALFLRIGGAP